MTGSSETTGGEPQHAPDAVLRDFLPHPYQSLDADGDIIAVNQAWLDLLGYDRADVVGEWFGDLLAPASRERFDAMFPTFTSEGCVSEVDYELLHAEGESIWVSFDGQIEFDEAGTVVEAHCQFAARTEQKHRKRELQRINTVLSTLLDNLPFGVLVEDSTREIIATNEVIGDLFDLPGSAAELTGRDCEQAAVEVKDRFADPDEFLTRTDELLDRRETVLDEPLRMADGRTLARSYVPYCLPEGEANLWLYRDITERTEQQKRFRAFLENSTDIITVLEPDGTFQYQSPSSERVLGYEPEEVLGETAFEYVHPDDREGVMETFSEAVTDPEMTPTVEYRFRHKNGSWRWLESRGTNQLDNPAIEGFVVNSRDITERTAHERELQRVRNRMEFALEVTDAIVWDWNVETDQATFYPSEERLYGTTVDTRAEFMDVLHPEDRQDVREALEHSLDTGEPKYEEVRIVRNGDVRWIEAPGKPVRDDDGPTRMIGVARDITERKRKERALQRQNERLEQFASMLSHDLRNPLNVAQRRLDFVRDEDDSDHLAAIERAHERMERLIDDILLFAREGNHLHETELIGLAAIADRSWHTVATPDATLVIETERTIRANESRLQQLLENLIRNAIDHGGEDVTIRIGELAEERGFYVADDGPGIPEGERDQVFDVGYSTAAAGTGFGLAIVREIAQAHEWAVSVTESKDGGARFEFETHQ